MLSACQNVNGKFRAHADRVMPLGMRLDSQAERHFVVCSGPTWRTAQKVRPRDLMNSTTIEHTAAGPTTRASTDRPRLNPPRPSPLLQREGLHGSQARPSGRWGASGSSSSRERRPARRKDPQGKGCQDPEEDGEVGIPLLLLLLLR